MIRTAQRGVHNGDREDWLLARHNNVAYKHQLVAASRQHEQSHDALCAADSNEHNFPRATVAITVTVDTTALAGDGNDSGVDAQQALVDAAAFPHRRRHALHVHAADAGDADDAPREQRLPPARSEHDTGLAIVTAA
jgi:hypothetical protein